MWYLIAVRQDLSILDNSVVVHEREFAIKRAMLDLCEVMVTCITYEVFWLSFIATA